MSFNNTTNTYCIFSFFVCVNILFYITIWVHLIIYVLIYLFWYLIVNIYTFCMMLGQPIYWHFRLKIYSRLTQSLHFPNWCFTCLQFLLWIRNTNIYTMFYDYNFYFKCIILKHSKKMCYVASGSPMIVCNKYSYITRHNFNNNKIHGHLFHF